ncbi:protein kinase [Psychrobacter sp. NG254]|uniref:protein kinase domain-containing protein n=1 Tax=Psychrobacter sp. NG254 TaxID=2782003 RepID=UPI0018871129|nr:protein kinase [Psychrobacter sp. NG254]MBF2720144.1 protein kinase [Psychrobacter sp. NG254]
MNFEDVETGNIMKINDIDWILEEKIGEGGNGVVWSASKEDSKSEKIAIKFVKCASSTKKTRFDREVTIQSSFDHKSIVRIYDYSTFGTTRWFTMPICSSASSLLIDRSATEICDEYRNIVSAVKYIHNEGMAHRDIKPDNILNLDGNLVLADFGLVTSLSSEDRRITKVGSKLGNFATIAPELRYVEDIDADFRPADVYSLGVTLWMLLNRNENGFDGQYAIAAKSMLEIALEGEKLELRSLHDLLEKATEYDPKLRPSIEEFEEKLIKWIEATKDFAVLISSKWINLQKEINPYNAHYLEFSDIDVIVSILNQIVRNDETANHCFLPRVGGLDLTRAEVKENGEVRLLMSGSSYYDCLPKALHYVNYQYKPSESYFFLETQPIAKPINSGLYEKNNEIVSYAEFANGDLTSAELYKDDIWKGRYIPNDTKSVTRVYEGSFLFVSRHSLYNSYGPAYDARHSKMGFEKFKIYYPRPYCSLQITPRPPQFIENDNSWENDPEFYIYLNSLDVPRVLSLLEKWPADEKSDDNEWGVIGSGSLFKFAIDHLSADFSFLEELNRKELLELVSIMYLGRETYGKRTNRDIWTFYLKHVKNESDEELRRIIKDKMPSATKEYISQGLKALGAEQADY